MSARASISRSATAPWPFQDAIMRGVVPSCGCEMGAQGADGGGGVGMGVIGVEWRGLAVRGIRVAVGAVGGGGGGPHQHPTKAPFILGTY
jgi:hypothetical protein